MKRIYIDDKLYHIAKDYAKDPFARRRKDFKRPPVLLQELYAALPEEDASYREYVQKIIDEYEDLNCLKPSEVARTKRKFDRILPEADLGKMFTIEGESAKFYDLIIKALRYDDLRKSDYIHNSGYLGLSIKTCVYCNAQLAVVVEKTAGGTQAKFQLDHIRPKSKYPFLAISFFNLCPSCGNCNSVKNDNSVKFDLYTEDSKDDLNPFLFYVTKDSIVKYMKSYDEECLKVGFLSTDGYQALSKDHDKNFSITGIYNTQKDIVAELIQKKEIYTESYKRHLAKQFKDLFKDESIINRLIIGNYDTVEDIHKRPMAKFTQDIARQLNLIK